MTAREEDDVKVIDTFLWQEAGRKASRGGKGGGASILFLA